MSGGPGVYLLPPDVDNSPGLSGSEEEKEYYIVCKDCQCPLQGLYRLIIRKSLFSLQHSGVYDNV